MRIAPQVELDADQRSRLEAIVRSRKLPARLIERSRIVLLAAAGYRNKQIAAELNLTPEKAARWRKRYLQLGLAGLEKDAPRPGRKPRITAKLVRELIAKTTQQTPPNATHWSTRSMAAAMGISEASVRRIWHAHGLKPHRTATFKLSNERQTGAASCLLLILAAIIYWQIREIDRVLSEAGSDADDLNFELLSHISPIGWDNVLLYGEYQLNRSLVRSERLSV
jgi:transposase